MNSSCCSGVSLTIPRLVVGVEGREDLPVGAEVGVRHVRAFDRAAHAERDAAELIRRHGAGLSFCIDALNAFAVMPARYSASFFPSSTVLLTGARSTPCSVNSPALIRCSARMQLRILHGDLRLVVDVVVHAVARVGAAILLPAGGRLVDLHDAQRLQEILAPLIFGVVLGR